MNLKSSEERPTKAQYTQLQTALSKRGAKAADIAGWIGADVKGRTRKEIADELRAKLRQLPKAKGSKKVKNANEN